MATKPRSEWSAAYRRRIERAEAKGKTKQQARGHHAHEHKTRKSRSELTTQQREYIKRFHRRQLKRLDHPEGSLDRMMNYAKRYGFARFRSIVETQSKLMKARKRANTPAARKRYIKSGGKLTAGHVPLGAGMANAIASLSPIRGPSSAPSGSGLIRGAGGDFGYEGEDEGDFYDEMAEEGWEDMFLEDSDTIEWLRYG